MQPNGTRIINKLSEYNLNPSNEHLMDKVIQYLYRTRHYTIKYGSKQFKQAMQHLAIIKTERILKYL